MTSLRYRPKLITFTAIFLMMLSAIAVKFSLQAREEPSVPTTRLGNPLRDDGIEGRALNVWDLQIFDGKLYVAGGSTVANTGPINVWAYDVARGQFIKEYTVPEEAIEHYRVWDNQLYIPAADPTKGNQNKFYLRGAEGTWHRHKSSKVKLAHVRDLLKTENNEILLVGNSPKPGKPSSRGTVIARNTSEGMTFQRAGVAHKKAAKLVDFNWFFSVFQFRGEILATNSLLRDASNYPGVAARFDPQRQKFISDFELTSAEFIPRKFRRFRGKYGINTIYRPWHPLEFDGHLIYPVRSYSTNRTNYREAYMNSIGLFFKSELGTPPREVKLPRQAIGEDLLIIDQELYVLANRAIAQDKFRISVYKTDRWDQKIEWQEVLSFVSVNKARAFEHLDGTFYFGLGQDYGEAIANSGDILSFTPK